MNKIEKITHKGKEIFFVNYSLYRRKEQRQDIVDLLEELMALMRQQPEKSALVLSDVTNIYLEKELSDLFTEMVEHNKPYVKRSAVVGVSGFKKSIHNIMMALTGRDIRICTDMESAKEYLVQE